jgi:hypothetical protein
MILILILQKKNANLNNAVLARIQSRISMSMAMNLRILQVHGMSSIEEVS